MYTYSHDRHLCIHSDIQGLQIVCTIYPLFYTTEAPTLEQAHAQYFLILKKIDRKLKQHSQM